MDVKNPTKTYFVNTCDDAIYTVCEFLSAQDIKSIGEVNSGMRVLMFTRIFDSLPTDIATRDCLTSLDKLNELNNRSLRSYVESNLTQSVSETKNQSFSVRYRRAVHLIDEYKMFALMNSNNHLTTGENVSADGSDSINLQNLLSLTSLIEGRNVKYMYRTVSDNIDYDCRKVVQFVVRLLSRFDDGAEMIARLCRHYKSTSTNSQENPDNILHHTLHRVVTRGLSDELCKRPKLLASVVSAIRRQENMERDRYRSMEDSITNNYSTNEQKASSFRTKSTKPRNGFRRYPRRYS
ncbi:hypothetical protein YASMINEVIRUS_555 [Yasminevirus sp. GU-2018]|uniref:Uncharacterized protein n=1 Tax=Yasminevirus sp. GU-2018 TaxID=2420051 RepID=A0A5K0U9H0_9VIRU|nr:hypothetical protein YASMINEVIRUS_555 [Yasminevirus sp. GU-2018]